MRSEAPPPGCSECSRVSTLGLPRRSWEDNKPDGLHVPDGRPGGADRPDAGRHMVLPRPWEGLDPGRGACSHRRVAGAGLVDDPARDRRPRMVACLQICWLMLLFPCGVGNTPKDARRMPASSTTSRSDCSG